MIIRVKDVLPKTPKLVVKFHISNLQHVIRFILGVEHEDDCPALKPFHVCECGKTLAIEQLQAAIHQLKRGK